MTKIFAEELLLDEEMEKVSGGTVGELKDLTNAMSGNSNCRNFVSGMNAKCRDFVRGISTDFPGTNILKAEHIESFMSKEMGINAHISVGIGGTDVGSEKNTYRDIKSGKFLSHDEVLKRIANYAV